MRFDHTLLVLACLLSAELVTTSSFAADASPWAAAPDVWPVQADSLPGVVSAISLSSDDMILAVGLDSGDVICLSANNGKILRRWSAHAERVNGLVFAAGDRQLISASDDQGLKSWNVESGAEVRSFAGCTSWVTCVDVDSEGKRIAAGSYDRAVRIWDGQTDSAASLVLTAHRGGVKGVDFSPDGKQLVSAAADRTAIVWNLETQQPVLTLKGHGGAVRAAKFSPDGAQIATAGEDGSARLWNAQSGERVQLLSGHAGMVWSLNYAPTGKLLATGGFDQTIRLWNPDGGQRIAVLRGPKTPICGVAFANDGETLFVAGQERSIFRYQSQTVTAKPDSGDATATEAQP